MHVQNRPNVSIDDAAAGARVARHLIGLGHRNLAFVGREISHDGFTWSADERFQGFVQEIQRSTPRAHIASITIGNGLESANEAVSQLLDLSPVPTGVFVLHDELALAMMLILQQRGLRVPEDISLVGFDDHPLAASAGLTTIHQDIEKIGNLGATMAMQLAHGEEVPTTSIVIPAPLIMRTSSASPNSNAFNA
jgi:DNA-binding LacI/PurR family transcriptional regulator